MNPLLSLKMLLGMDRCHHHGAYKKYRANTGVVWQLSVVDPNMAFSICVKGH